MKHILRALVVIALGLPITVRASVVEVDEPAVCFKCHLDVQELDRKKSVHSVFAAGECSSCHNPHASDHASLLYSDARELCVSCHEQYSHENLKLNKHDPTVSGDCMSCHDPHASDHDNLLKQSVTPLCTTCHPAVTDWLSQTHVHAPAADNDCITCHDPHSSSEPGLLKSTMPALCFNCHEGGPVFDKAHRGYKVSEANCVTCHDAHASSEKSLLMANQHAPFKADRCDACHAKAGAAASSFALTGSVKVVCTECHVDVKGEEKLAYHHNLDDERSCLNCHNPHASPTESLLSARQSVTCMKCHFMGQSYAGKPRQAYITHEGMDCTNCHSPHGSDDSRYLKADEVKLCADCHADAHRSSHPVGGDIIDPRNNRTLTCLSCHQLHGADFPQYLPLNPQMELCIQCHRR